MSLNFSNFILAYTVILYKYQMGRPSAASFYLALIMGHTEEVNQTHYNYDIMELTIKKSAMEQICAMST